jgi:DNA polymerase III alpha subunit
MTITPLHVRSGHSLLRGTATPQRLVARAAQIGHSELALTDVNSLAGAPAFWQAAVDANVRPFIGAELLTEPHRTVALIRDDTGYGNLCQLITQQYQQRRDLPADLTEGLELIVDHPQMIEHLLATGVSTQRLWIGIDPGWQRRGMVRQLTDMAERLRLPLTATGAALITDGDDIAVARLQAAIRLQTTIKAVPESALPPGSAFLRSAQTLADQLADWPEAIANNRRLVERCSGFALLPRQPVFPAFDCPDGLSPPIYLKDLCQRGAIWRYRLSPPEGLNARLDRELGLIESKGFSENFLVVWDIVQHARSLGAPVAGRGSGASSLVAYLLGITNVCPLAHDIPFERFLNAQRVDFPDLDIDFCWRIRDDVINYAVGRWGHDRAAMVCTHNTFQAQSALRETAKAMGFSNDQLAAPGDTADPRLRQAATLSQRLVGLPHVFSVHPGGVVMAPTRLDRFAPILPSAKGVRITQFEKDAVEAMGLVKLDLLGNRSLSTIRAACEIIQERSGHAVDPERLDDTDPATLAVLQAGDTVGCNQLESPAMRNLLRAMQPTGRRDVMKALALVRPGAASIGMKEVFVRRHRGLDPVPPSDPRVDRVLADTYGVMLYEDDVLLLAAAMLGDSPATADRFRKRVQKCPNDEERLELSREFIGRCVSAGIDRELVEDIWVQMAKFNAYSFCRAHAASYAQLAWTVAYLKTHEPLAFWVGALNNNQSMYHPRVYVEQAKRMGIRFLPPDVNLSQTEFAPEGNAIRVGLNFVGGLGPASVETILDARRHGPFVGLSDFVSRTRLGDEEARALILCGAFDALGRNRPAMMMELRLAGHLAPAGAKGSACLLPTEVSLPVEPDDYPPARKLTEQRQILGISVGPHVLTPYRDKLAEHVSIDSRLLAQHVGKSVRLAGVLEAMRTAPTSRGRSVTFLTLDDEFGLFEAVVFDRSRRTAVRGYGPHVIGGRVQEQYGTMTVIADSVSCPFRSRS